MNDLRARLENLAAHNQTITYGTLARDLGLTAPGSIAVLTGMLETLMEQDASLGRPFLASICAGKQNDNQPALGFFVKARALGVFTGDDPVAFTAEQRLALSQIVGNS
jgi:hypothetical protein